jgi:hypothetical protein
MRLLSAMALSLAAASASADILFCLGNGQCGGSGDVENVLLRKDTSGTTVFGDTNQTNTEIFFTTTQSNGGAELSIPSNGQARIEGVGGAQITDLTFGATDATIGFTKAVFNVDTLENTVVSIEAKDQFGTSFNFNLNADGSGQNYVTVYTILDQWIDTITLTGDGIAAIEDLQQVRVGPGSFPGGGGPGTVGEVPIPAAAWLFGSALVGLGGVARKRKA